jgi:hypothetical protein
MTMHCQTHEVFVSLVFLSLCPLDLLCKVTFGPLAWSFDLHNNRSQTIVQLCVDMVLTSQLISWSCVCLWIPWKYTQGSKKEWSTSRTHKAENSDYMSKSAGTSKLKPKCVRFL